MNEGDEAYSKRFRYTLNLFLHIPPYVCWGYNLLLDMLFFATHSTTRCSGKQLCSVSFCRGQMSESCDPGLDRNMKAKRCEFYVGCECVSVLAGQGDMHPEFSHEYCDSAGNSPDMTALHDKIRYAHTQVLKNGPTNAEGDPECAYFAMQPCELNATDSGMNVSSNDDQGSNQSEQFVNNICKRFRQLGMSYSRSLDAARGNQMWDYGQQHWSYIREQLQYAQEESLEGSTFITTASDFQLYTGEEIMDHRHIQDVLVFFP